MARLPGRPLIVGNWKMNGIRSDLAEVDAIAAGASSLSSELVICPPATLLYEAGQRLVGCGVRLGAQICSDDLSAGLLADMGVEYVLIGHSERRRLCGETDARVSAAIRATKLAGITPIVCIGEELAARRSGQTFAAIEQQLCDSLKGVADMSRLCIAYEPVWAIGSGQAPHVFEVAACVRHIRSVLQKLYDAHVAQTRIVYGGSVCADNARRFLETEGIDGLLVGGAALKADTFLAIALAAENAQSAF